jgi:hypothetical protein
VVEFITVGMLLLLPMVYLVLTLGRVQAASFAVDGSAREAARAYVTAASDADGTQRAEAAVRLGVVDQGFSSGAARLSIECSADPCLDPGATVIARTRLRVTLPGVPAFLSTIIPAEITVRSAQAASVDVFRAVPGP